MMMKRAEVARNATRYAELLAYADGIVMETLVEPGQVVSAGQVVLRLAHAGPREALIQLPETLRPAMAAAKTRIKDFEIAWDDNETGLKPQDPAHWRQIDDAADAALDEPAIVPAVRAPAQRRRHAQLRAVLAVAVPARDFALPLAADVAIAVLLLPLPVAAQSDGQRLRILGDTALHVPRTARLRGEGLGRGCGHEQPERQTGQGMRARGRGKAGRTWRVAVWSGHG